MKLLILILQITSTLLFLSSTKSDTPDEKCLSDFRKAALKAHNKYRKMHSVSGLKEKSEIDDVAQQHAEYMANSGSFGHSDSDYGENIAYRGSSEKLDCAKYGKYFSQMWYDEVNDPGYDFSNPGFSSGTGHFTQLVWKSSKSVGFGFAIKKKGSMLYAYGVANYDPPGNFMNKYKENVFPLKN